MIARRGFTLSETLMASTLLIVLSGVLFQTLVPVLRNAARMDQKQDNIQRVIIFREDLTRRLQAGKVIKVNTHNIEYLAPLTAETKVGSLPRIDGLEMVEYDEAHVRHIGFLSNGNVVEKTTGVNRPLRVLLSLGIEGRIAYDAREAPLLRVKVSTRYGQPSQESPLAEYSFHVILDRYLEQIRTQ